MGLLLKWSGRKEDVILVAGDVVCFVLALGISLIVWIGVVPGVALIYSYLFPFTILFLLWIVVFHIAGLYDRHVLLLKHRIVGLLFYSTGVNFLIATLLFYFFPYFDIAPTFFLLTYFIVLFVLVVIWRTTGYEFILWRGSKRNAILVGSGSDMRELKEYVNNNRGFGFRFISSIDLEKIDMIDVKQDVLNLIYSENVKLIGTDLRHQNVDRLLPYMYNLIFSRIRFVNIQRMYEEVFERVPLSALKYSWFLENISMSPSTPYDVVKRGIDFLAAILIGVVALVLHPFIVMSLKLSYGQKSVVIRREYIGRNNVPVMIPAFRTRSAEGKVSWIGGVLERTGLRRLPSLWSVIKGDLSFIGPSLIERSLDSHWEEHMPYYTVRHIIRPGIISWGSEQHSDPYSIFSYDLYYIKNRSLVLDMRIVMSVLKNIIK